MSGCDLERHVREAFDGIEAPDEAKRQALAYVLGQEGADRPSAMPPSLPSQARPRQRAQARRAVRFLGYAMAACVALVAVVFGAAQLGVDRAVVETDAPGQAASVASGGDEGARSASTADLEPTAFVDIDINPSVQLQLNRADEVVAAKGINDDGAAVLSRVSLDGLSYERALRALVASDAMAPYLDADALVVVSVSSSDAAQQRSLTAASEECLADAPYQVDCHGVSQQLYDEAHGHGMGCGRYAAAVELAELDPGVSVEDCAGMTMRELRDRIASHRAGDGSGATSGPRAGCGGGRGAHHGWH